MAKTIKVTIGDEEYEVPRLLVEQAEDLAGLWENSDENGIPLDAEGNALKGKALFGRTIDLASIVLRHALPAIPDFRKLDCGIEDLQTASAKVLEFSRLSRSARSAPEGNGQAGTSPAP